jgi:hypothetical protein
METGSHTPGHHDLRLYKNSMYQCPDSGKRINEQPKTFTIVNAAQ